MLGKNAFSLHEHCYQITYLNHLLRENRRYVSKTKLITRFTFCFMCIINCIKRGS